MKCKNCNREVPNKSFITENGCKWCSVVSKKQEQNYEVLPVGKYTIAFDLDATLCESIRRNHPEDILKVKPKKIITFLNKLWIDIVKELKGRGHKIVIFTRRGHLENGTELTKKWLKKYKVSYDKLITAKPHFDILIDDRAISVYRQNYWTANIIEKYAKLASIKMKTIKNNNE